MKILKYAFRTLMIVSIASFGLSCNNDSGMAPMFSFSFENQKGNSFTVSHGANVEVDLTVTSSADLERIEIFRRQGIGQDSEKIATFESRLNEVSGKTFTTQIVYDDIQNDMSFSVFALDSEGNYASAMVTFLLDVQTFDELVMQDGNANAVSKSFCDTRNGVLLHYAILKSDIANVDFGFVYQEDNAAIRAAIVAADEYAKSGIYADMYDVPTGFAIVKAADDIWSTAADLEAKFNEGTALPTVGGYNSIAADVKDGDIYAFRNVHGKYGILKVINLNRAEENSNGSQTIKIQFSVTR